MEKPAVTEDSSQTPIGYDVEQPISYQDIDCQPMSSGGYRHDMYEDLSGTGTSPPSLFDVDNYSKCRSRSAVLQRLNKTQPMVHQPLIVAAFLRPAQYQASERLCILAYHM